MVVVRLRLKHWGLTLLFLFGVFCLYLGFNGSKGKIETAPPVQQGKVVKTADSGMPETSFFVTYRQNRTDSREQQIDLLNQLINNPNSSADTRESAQKQLLQLTKTIHLEDQVESLVLAKGFKDAAAQLVDNGLNLMVYGDQFTADQITRLQDIAVRVTGLRTENIVIIPRK